MVLYTIGYEGLDQNQFINLLNNHGISVVADVRKLPLSRKKGFSKSGLSETLSNKNIEYINFNELGAPRELRNELKETGDYYKFFKKYQRELANHLDRVDGIITMVNSGENVALLCFEKEPDICHRKIIADEVKKRDGNILKVNHLKVFN